MDPRLRGDDGLLEFVGSPKTTSPTEGASFQWINDKQERYHVYTQ
jgi:hypothetical protein